MALEYKVKDCAVITDDDGAKKKRVGFTIYDNETEQTYICNKDMDFVDNKTDETYLKEYADSIKSDVEEWQNGYTNIGKPFDVSSGEFSK
jgi:hypothetical protein